MLGNLEQILNDIEELSYDSTVNHRDLVRSLKEIKTSLIPKANEDNLKKVWMEIQVNPKEDVELVKMPCYPVDAQALAMIKVLERYNSYWQAARKVKLVKVSVADLGFKKPTGFYEIMRKAADKKLKACNPFAPIKFFLGRTMLKPICIAMRPIDNVEYHEFAHYECPDIFTMYEDKGRLCLGAECKPRHAIDRTYSLSTEFIFEL